MPSILPQLANQRRHSPAATGGFSMVELLVTLVIGIILASIAVPQFGSFIKTQQSVSEINNLMDDIQFARSEALKEGQFVTVCVSSSGTACTSGAWNTGWLVCSNPAFTTSAQTCATGTSNILRVQPGLTTSDSLVASPTNTTVTYNRDGFAAGLSTTGQLFTLHNSPTITAGTRCLWLDVLGHMYIQTSGQGDATTAQGSNTCS